ncbi:Jouberin [Hypsibius exemplaris]|uniref:Jouberin n=1 Tax=Hypsibius exemplaris TaxID=2072580 RepID=A0A1W0WTM9_HYPEX|nr:Jouberin [Hypsibius exemplaris]
MERPSESFAKSVTKHRFQELINSRPTSADGQTKEDYNGSATLFTRGDGDGILMATKPIPRRFSKDATEAAQRLRSTADTIRKVLDETAENETAIREDNVKLRRPRRTNKAKISGETNERSSSVQVESLPTAPVRPRRRKETFPSAATLQSSYETIIEMTSVGSTIDGESEQESRSQSAVKKAVLVSPRGFRAEERQRSRLKKIREKIKTASEILDETLPVGPPEQILPVMNNDSPEFDAKPPETRQENGEDVVLKTIPKTSALAITIHRTDKITGDSFLLRAAVRVLLMSSSSGRMFRKEYRNGQLIDEYISPLTTQLCDLSTPDASLPSWEQTLIFEEEFGYFFREDEAIIFFELVNSSITEKENKNNSSENLKATEQVRTIAWAFLKLTERNRANLSDHRVRLQLYFPDQGIFRQRSQQKDAPIVYNWWKSRHRLKYPSTLYVTLLQVPMPASRTGELSNQLPKNSQTTYTAIRDILETASTASLRDLTNQQTVLSDPDIRGSNSVSSVVSDYPLSRQPNQICLIPDKQLMPLTAGHQGASVVLFSHNGRSLACGGLERTGIACVYVYTFPSGQLQRRLPDFRGIIYDLEWSRDDSLLLTACADGTVKVWSLVDTLREKVVASLPHPGFVYCARFHPKRQQVVATGCYDGIVRIWRLESHSSEYTLLQELGGHNSFVNVLLFESSGRSFFSAGNDSIVRQWGCGESSPEEGSWKLLQGSSGNLSGRTTITDLQLSPKTKELIVLYQSGDICFLDQKGLQLMRKITGALPMRHRVRCKVSPCGTNLYVANGDSSVNVIETTSGKVIGNIPNGMRSVPAMDIDYHPFQHVLVFCALGTAERVEVWGCSDDASGSKAQVGIPEEYFDSPARINSLIVGDGDSRQLFSPVSLNNDKIADVIQKLDSITHDIRTRGKQRLPRKEEGPSTRNANPTAEPIQQPVRSPHWSMRSGLLPFPAQYNAAGLLPNFSQI